MKTNLFIFLIIFDNIMAVFKKSSEISEKRFGEFDEEETNRINSELRQKDHLGFDSNGVFRRQFLHMNNPRREDNTGINSESQIATIDSLGNRHFSSMNNLSKEEKRGINLAVQNAYIDSLGRCKQSLSMDNPSNILRNAPAKEFDQRKESQHSEGNLEEFVKVHENVEPSKKRALEFSNEEDFDDWIKSSDWTTTKKGYNCKAHLKVMRQKNSPIIIAEEAGIQHDHQPKQPLVGSMKMTEAMKAIIRREYFQNGRKGKQIRDILLDLNRDNLSETPTVAQIKNFVDYEKRKGTGKLNAKPNELMNERGTGKEINRNRSEKYFGLGQGSSSAREETRGEESENPNFGDDGHQRKKLKVTDNI